uniref:Matrin-type domain-containing protein n=1 Tax=Leersia perrieri TaxID=77586 RepID=A0A0D9XDU7_9ORYZ
MELPRRGQSSQPPDGDDDGGGGGRRFPDSTPPNGREPSPAPAPPPARGDDVVAAALWRQKEELLWELHKVTVRREMLLCDLFETERAMASRFAAARHHPPGAPVTTTPPPPPPPPVQWRQRDVLPAGRDYAWRGAPRSGEQETPWWRRSPSAVGTPVYPHVERSPSSPLSRGKPADDGERQEHGGSSGSPAISPPVLPAPNVEQSTPFSGKESAAAASVVGIGANADAKQELLGHGVTPGGEHVVRPKKEEGEIAVDGHATQLMGESTVRKSSDEHPKPKPVESITRGLSDERVLQQCQDKLADQEIAASDEQKRVVLNDELTPESRSSGVKRQLATETSPAKKPRSLENYNGPVSFLNCGVCNVKLTSPQELIAHRASLLHRSNLAPLQSGNKDTTGMSTTMNTEAVKHQAEKKIEKPHSSEWNNSSAYNYQGKSTSESGFHSQKQLHLGGRNEEEACRRASATDREDAADLGRKNSRVYICEICDVRCHSEKVMESHLSGKRHRENILRCSNFVAV